MEENRDYSKTKESIAFLGGFLFSSLIESISLYFFIKEEINVSYLGLVFSLINIIVILYLGFSVKKVAMSTGMLAPTLIGITISLIIIANRLFVLGIKFLVIDKTHARRFEAATSMWLLLCGAWYITEQGFPARG